MRHCELSSVPAIGEFVQHDNRLYRVQAVVWMLPTDKVSEEACVLLVPHNEYV